ncbi:enhancer of polycomb-like-domain-containing protein [Thamnocephalis sphaerospora]|uniref:Enhancer of polycomb-like protein n=1 Tax=Thamnocephalis sphaerospora TaxID=78915 RepID=A0A4P9XXH3_9FUNG|nr:enhancer of polycomb-like-domain-containing protein [Thamnocephalis sphaerospora]|eukprot:RKP11076.1 enhancer of polycomb-like-domain-containing protein [Thamnocephalis sphaerospora]
MSKAKSFRSRKVDAKRPLPVYRASEIPDLDEGLSAQRSVPLVETGVEKEEETEHHLQAAISASQTNNSVQPVYIPTPDASRIAPDYDVFYRAQFHRPHTYIRFSSTVEECGGVGYTMDDADKRWLDAWLASPDAEPPAPSDGATAVGANGARRSISPITLLDEDLFENIMDAFEDLSERQVGAENWPYEQVESAVKSLSLRPASQHPQVLAAMSDIPHAVKATFAHWQARRKAQPQGSMSIMPRLRTEERSQKETDPYVCFRRRELKPIRKTRRSDAQSFDKLRQLRAELHQACHLLELVDRREKMRRESLVLEQLCFDQKMTMRDLRKRLGYKDESDGLYHIKKKIKKADIRVTPGGSAKAHQRPLLGLPGQAGHGDELSLRVSAAMAMSSAHDEQFAKRIDEELQQRRVRDIGWRDITEDPFQPFAMPLGEQRFRAFNQRASHQYRRRVGRGGRVFLDRRALRQPMPAFSAPMVHGVHNKGDYSTDAADAVRRLAERMRYDCDGESSWPDPWAAAKFDEWSPGLLSYRAGLLTPADMQQARTRPWLAGQPRPPPRSLASVQEKLQHALTADITASLSPSGAAPLGAGLDEGSAVVAHAAPQTVTMETSPKHAAPTGHPADTSPAVGTPSKHAHFTPGPTLSPSPVSPMSHSPAVKAAPSPVTPKPPLPSPSAVVNANRNMGALMLTTGDALARSIPSAHAPSTPQAVHTSNPFDVVSSSLGGPLGKTPLMCNSPMLTGTPDSPALAAGSVLNSAMLGRKKRSIKLQSVPADAS